MEVYYTAFVRFINRVYYTAFVRFINWVFSIGKLLDFSSTHEVNEGDWARFSCTVKKEKGTVLWKIGNYTKEEGNALNKIETRGLITVRKYDDTAAKEIYEDVGITNGIEILATAELDKVPVQCVVLLYNHSYEYSKFVVLTVHPTTTNTTQSKFQSVELPL